MQPVKGGCNWCSPIVILFSPPVHLQKFFPHPLVENGTLVGDLSTEVVYNMGLGLPFLALSYPAVVFSTITSRLKERGILGH